MQEKWLHEADQRADNWRASYAILCGDAEFPVLLVKHTIKDDEFEIMHIPELCDNHWEILKALRYDQDLIELVGKYFSGDASRDDILDRVYELDLKPEPYTTAERIYSKELDEMIDRTLKSIIDQIVGLGVDRRRATKFVDGLWDGGKSL